MGFNARETCRIIEKLNQTGDLKKGVFLNTNGGPAGGGIFRIIIEDNTANNMLPDGYDIAKPDNQIINTALLAKNNSDVDVILVTNDISMRINASVCGLKDNVQSYHNDRISSSEIYTGREEITVSSEVIDKLYQDKSIRSELAGINPKTAIENEFFVLKKRSGICISCLSGWPIKAY